MLQRTAVDPVSEYAETRLGGTRRYALFLDRLVFESTGSILSAHLKIEFPLEQLNPQYTKVVVTSQAFKSGLAFSVLGAFLAGFIGFMSRDFFLDFSGGNLTPTPVFCTVLFVLLAVGGLFVALLAPRRLEYLHFGSTSGGSGFDIGRRGKFKDQFDGFISRLVAAIEEARSSEPAC